MLNGREQKKERKKIVKMLNKFETEMLNTIPSKIISENPSEVI